MPEAVLQRVMERAICTQGRSFRARGLSGTAAFIRGLHITNALHVVAISCSTVKCQVQACRQVWSVTWACIWMSSGSPDRTCFLSGVVDHWITGTKAVQEAQIDKQVPSSIKNGLAIWTLSITEVPVPKLPNTCKNGTISDSQTTSTPQQT